MFCNLNKVEYSIDKTNLEDVFLRNQIRHKIVERMSKSDRVKVLKEIDDENLKLAVINENISKINRNKCEDYNRLTDEEFLYAIVKLGRELKPDFIMSRNQGLEIRKIFLSDKANISVNIDGLTLVKSYDSFQFVDQKIETDFSFRIDGPSTLDTEYFYLDFTGDTSNRNVGKEDYPLTIRNAQPNDVYLIKGYEKQLRRLFIDWKVPVPLRKRWPVIIDKKGTIIYVPRYQKDFKKENNCNFYVK